MTVTPVLADQLEDAGVRERLRDFLVEWRIGAAEADLPRGAGRVPRRLRSGAARATGARWSCSTRPAATRCGRSSARRAEGRVALAASAATHAVLPLLATRRGPAPAARRRHPLAPPPLRLGRRLLAARVRLRARARVAPGRGRGAAGSASTRAPTSEPLRGAGAGARPRPGRWRCRSTGRRSSWLWSLDGYPSDPAHAQFAGKSLRGIRLWKVGGGAYDPAAAAARGAAPGRRVPRRRRRAPARASRPSSGRRGLLVFAIDTELLGHWWSEGPIWLRAVLEGAAAAGVRLVTVPEALAEHEPVERAAGAPRPGARARTSRTWDSPRGRRPRLGGAAAGAAAAAGARATGSRRRRGAARRARAARRCRRATGPSSTSAARPATTPSSGPPTTPGRCWRP